MRRGRKAKGRTRYEGDPARPSDSIEAGVLRGSGPASLAYLEFVVVLTATYRLYILVSRIR
jgi:hypothetical protein